MTEDVTLAVLEDSVTFWNLVRTMANVASLMGALLSAEEVDRSLRAVVLNLKKRQSGALNGGMRGMYIYFAFSCPILSHPVSSNRIIVSSPLASAPLVSLYDDVVLLSLISSLFTLTLTSFHPCLQVYFVCACTYILQLMNTCLLK